MQITKTHEFIRYVKYMASGNLSGLIIQFEALKEDTETAEGTGAIEENAR